MEDEKKFEEQEEGQNGMKAWLQDNLRIIISVVIVVAIAGGIYSYSKRTQPVSETGEESVEQLTEENENVEVASVEEKTATKAPEATKEVVKKEQVTSVATSEETDSAFVEKAGKGDGSTHLARRALANYLEKNPDSSLTAEHKIYVEDYLRKYSGFKGRVRVGTSVDFSKELIRQAVEKSKQLNDRQLKNLHQYAVRVPSLS